MHPVLLETHHSLRVCVCLFVFFFFFFLHIDFSWTLLMYILLWALGPLGPITLLVQHTYTCTALYLYRTLMPPI